MPDFENTSVESVAPETVTPAADAQGDASTEEVVISAESSSSESPAQTGSGESVANPPADGAQPQSQKDIDRAFGQRLAQERRKFEQSDAYQLGTRLINEKAQREGITPAEAYQRIQQERLDATAEAYARNPKQFYKDLLNNNIGGQPQPPQTETPDMQADRVGRELASVQLPAGFDIRRDLDQDTYNNIVEYGAAAAMRIWRAEHANNVQMELQRRQAGPSPMRPTSGASQQSAPTDFSKLSSEEFYKKRAEIKQAVLDGKRVRFS